MKFKDVVVINSYAGSLTVGATQGGYNILASLEDSGYGLDAQRANFPDLTYIDELPWPEADLTDVMVIAHPPCAAFSAQNNSTNKGVSSSHFDCTRRVIDYACLHNAAAVMIESVPGALEGAREFYDTYPQQYGYDVYRIMQNAVTFGVPQWRPRYWSVLTRRGVLKHSNDALILHHTRKYVTLGEALGEGIPGDKNEYTERYWAKQLEGLYTGGMRDIDIMYMLAHNNGHLARVLGEKYGLEKDEAKQRFTISSFDSHVFTLLPPDGYSHTVMCVSNWLWMGRPVNMPELNVIAGFPADYKFPRPREQKCYLSKGVAPPVARWLLDEVSSNLSNTAYSSCDAAEHLYIIKPGEMADLRIKKAQALQRDLFTK